MRRRCACTASMCRCPTPPIWKKYSCHSPNGWWTPGRRSSEGERLMATNILMPALSPTMTEGTLSRWLKKEGENVRAGDVIAEIETDKATMEVEAVDEGVLGKILVGDGTEGVKVNQPIAGLVEQGEKVPADAGGAAAEQPAVKPAPAQPEAAPAPQARAAESPAQVAPN